MGPIKYLFWIVVIILTPRNVNASNPQHQSDVDAMRDDNSVYTFEVQPPSSGEMNNYTERGLQHRMQVLAYLCSKQSCTKNFNCSMNSMTKTLINCLYTANLFSDNELNVRYRFNQRMRFYESTYTNIQLLLFAQANVSTVSIAREYIQRLSNISHTNADITRLILTDTLYNNRIATQNSTGALLLHRLRNIFTPTNDTTPPCIPFDPDTLDKIFRDFASNSPWYCTLIVLLLVKLIIMYGFHAHQIGKWFVARKKNNPNSTKNTSNGGGASRGFFRMKKQRTTITNDDHDGHTIEMVTLPPPTESHTLI